MTSIDNKPKPGTLKRDALAVFGFFVLCALGYMFSNPFAAAAGGALAASAFNYEWPRNALAFFGLSGGVLIIGRLALEVFA